MEKHRLKWAFFTFFVTFFIGKTTGVQRDALYPFGVFRNDQRMSIGDDISTPEIQLKTKIAFYEGSHRSVYINLNGHLSFDTEIPVFKSDFILPIGFKIIAPFLADIDTRLSGNVYYRETQDPSLLETATREIQRNFPRAITFNAESLFIVTWDMVGYYKEQYDQTNTFQVVIASDGFDSYTFFHYVDDGINWLQSQGKNMPVHQDPPAQAGFDAGDHSRSYTLPGSGYAEVRQLATGSNINVNGAWLFRIGDLGGSNINLPPSSDINEVLPESGTSALTCGQGCSTDASCTNYQTGSCCKCDGGYFGNGINCLQTGTPQRINGRVSGTVNGVVIEPVVLHTYVVTSDGRAYTAISRMPTEIGQSLQAVHTLGGIMGWLFSLPSSPTSENGFTTTGGDFNRTATIQFVSGGQMLTINEQFEGQGVHGYMKVTTKLSGNIPSLAEKARITVDDYKEEYKRTAPGVIKSYTTHTYRIDGVPFRFNLDQTITYRECSARPPMADSQKLSVNRNFITFDDREQIVRFAQSNRIISVSGGDQGQDPCRDNPCGPNSACTPNGDVYTCACKNGYRGEQGTSCRDIDECRENLHDCDNNAQCYNSDGNFECRCNPGYRGNGRQCQRDLSCADLTCDVNARCVFDSDIGEPRCECNPGFIGDGTQCAPVEFGCNEVNNCGENAECLYDSTEGRYKCECMDGFSGDGYSCTDSEPTHPPRPTPTQRPTPRSTTEDQNCRNCDRNANCIYDVDRFSFRCHCKEGFTGDGYRCQEIAEVQDCSTLRNCDPNARCVYDDRYDQHVCLCERGFRGDGYRCEREEQDCSVVSICDYNAQCVYDATYRRHNCRCNEGYEGDGKTCTQTEISCNQVNNCDVNAECTYDESTRNYMCRCRQGYEGDGTVCSPVVDCVKDPNMCDRNARCLRQGYNHVCICNNGYRGDGSRCAPIGDSSSYLMYAQGLSIIQIPFKPTKEDKGKQVLLIPGQTAVGIDVDCYSRYFYWTDVSGKAISKAKLDGTDSEVLLRGLGSPEGVAIDWVAGNMYWTDSGTDTIEVAKVDGTYRKALFNTDIHDPRAIVVDPVAGVMFWSDWNRKAPKIEMANMDGSNRKTLVDTDLGLPNGLALNYDDREKELCWSDAGTMHIECIKYNGIGRRTVYGLASYPFDLTMNGDTIYWTDWDQKSLQSIDRFGGDPKEPMITPPGGNGKMYGIATVRDQCPRGNNACNYNNGGCRFLCLPSPNGGRTCACPDDVEEEECNTVNLLL